MSSGRWSIASAKAELSRLVNEASQAPQFIEKRGRPVAVVVSAEEYARMAEAGRAGERWRELLDLSAELRAEGGHALKIPRRTSRRSPFGRTQR